MRRTPRILALCSVVAVTTMLALSPSAGTGAAAHAGTWCPDGLTLVHVGDGHACTHGGDGVPTLAADATSARGSGLTEAPCPGNGRRGKRVRVFYGYPQGTAPRLADHKPTIADALRTADLNLDAQSPGTEGQHYRFWCETDLRPTIRTIELVPVGGDAAYDVDDVIGSLYDQVGLGLGEANHRAGRMVYVVFVDHLGGVSAPAGQATLYWDDDPAPSSNANNASGLGPRFAMVQLGYGVPTEAHIFQHEVGHTLGAVQGSAPHSSGAGHCFELYDLMCYDDGGPYFDGGGELVPACAAMPDGQHVWDCNGDDWYAVEPAAGSYLEDHWNVVRSGWLSWKR